MRGEISKSLQTRNFCIRMDQRTLVAVVGGCLLHVAHMGSKTQICRLEKMHQFIYKMLIFILGFAKLLVFFFDICILFLHNFLCFSFFLYFSFLYYEIRLIGNREKIIVKQKGAVNDYVLLSQKPSQNFISVHIILVKNAWDF